MLKLIAAFAAIMAITMLIYTCSPYAPLDGGAPPLQAIQDGGAPQGDSN